MEPIYGEADIGQDGMLRLQMGNAFRGQKVRYRVTPVPSIRPKVKGNGDDLRWAYVYAIGKGHCLLCLGDSQKDDTPPKDQLTINRQHVIPTSWANELPSSGGASPRTAMQVIARHLPSLWEECVCDYAGITTPLPPNALEQSLQFVHSPLNLVPSCLQHNDPGDSCLNHVFLSYAREDEKPPREVEDWIRRRIQRYVDAAKEVNRKLHPEYSLLSLARLDFATLEAAWTRAGELLSAVAGWENPLKQMGGLRTIARRFQRSDTVPPPPLPEFIWASELLRGSRLRELSKKFGSGYAMYRERSKTGVLLDESACRREQYRSALNETLRFAFAEDILHAELIHSHVRVPSIPSEARDKRMYLRMLESLRIAPKVFEDSYGKLTPTTDELLNLEILAPIVERTLGEVHRTVGDMRDAPAKCLDLLPKLLGHSQLGVEQMRMHFEALLR